MSLSVQRSKLEPLFGFIVRLIESICYAAPAAAAARGSALSSSSWARSACKIYRLSAAVAYLEGPWSVRWGG